MTKLSESYKPVLHVLETKNNGACAQINVIDTLGFSDCTIYLLLGETDVPVDAKVEESDDASAWSDVGDTAMTQLEATDDNVIVAWEIPLASRKRYLRVLPTVGDVTGATLAVLALLSGYNRSQEDLCEAELEEQLDLN